MHLKSLSIIVLLGLLVSCSKERVHIKPTISDITESVYASGKVKADQQYNVYSTVNGILQSILVKAGDSVSIGTQLFVLDNMTSELNSQNALLALQLSEENNKSSSDKLKEVESTVELAYQKYLLDSSLFVRQKKLFEQNVGSKLDLEQKQLNLTASRTNYESANARFKQLKTVLAKELKNAGLNYSISQKMANDFTIKSTVNGRIYDVLKEQGELITPQTQLAVVGSGTQFYIELEVDENDISKIRIGQEVVVNMDSYKDEVFTAKLTHIYPIMNERTHTFTVKAAFVEQPKVLYPNLSLEANIVLNTKKNAIVIPKEYLVDGKFVMISEDEKQEVKIGLKDYKKVEILSGLDSTQFIYKPL
ncbi:MAG: efflux RND transporter periplasmic adaptor subunit [Bacteroidetes bacterium]|nr:efflux RND transporter periplasmic adaptor subunit [Bacteroidota bacterium]